MSARAATKGQRNTHLDVRLMSSLKRSGTSLVTMMCVSFGLWRSSVETPPAPSNAAVMKVVRTATGVLAS